MDKLDLKNYNDLIKEYEEYLQLENNPIGPTIPGEDGLTTPQIILIVCGCVVGVLLVGGATFFVVKNVRKGKGGKEDEENN